MGNFFSLKFRSISLLKLIFLKFSLLVCCQDLWAIQEAIVTADRAVVYADEEMTSPVGYVARGKKIKVGNIARNKAQVYPIIVSGKMAFIRLVDINTQTEYQDPSRLVAERFQKQTAQEEMKTSFGLTYYNYNSQIQLSKTNGGVDDNDSVSWSGISLMGKGMARNKWELQLMTNFMSAKADVEEFRALEAGLGAGYRLMEFGKFSGRIEAQFMAIPWASYAHGSSFRVNGQGYSVGAGVNFAYALTEHWGLNAYSGVYYTKLGGFKVPRPYSPIEPIFYGPRLGAGVHYAF